MRRAGCNAIVLFPSRREARRRAAARAAQQELSPKPPLPPRPAPFEIRVRPGIAGEVTLVGYDAEGHPCVAFSARERMLAPVVFDHLRAWLPELLDIEQRAIQS